MTQKQGKLLPGEGDLLNYAEWQEMCELSLEYPTLRKLLDTLVTTYYTVKEHK